MFTISSVRLRDGRWSCLPGCRATRCGYRRRVDVGDEGGSLRPWLLGIATNVARNTRRAARRYDGALARIAKPDPVPDFADEVAGRVDDRERLALARTALAALRKPEREVLALCVWSGLDYAEAAQALGVPVGTVRSRLSRARKRLEKLLAAKNVQIPEGNWELQLRRGQGEGDRETAVRSTQEIIR